MKLDSVAVELHKEVTNWRHHIHKNPELSMKEYKTSAFIKGILAEIGVSYREFAGTGVVAHVKKGSGNRAIGMRCELDALPMCEANTFDHASINSGVMHACGHDGHTAMLLGALKALKNWGQFDGTIYFIFQPGEEGAGGAEIMLDEGLLRHCPMEEVYAIHNWPGIDVGKAGIVFGPVMAAANFFTIEIFGKGGHAAMPHLTSDPVIVASHLITALQTLVSRNVNPLHGAVLSATVVEGGTAPNIIADHVKIEGTVRALRSEVNDLVQRRIKEMAEGFSKAFAVEIHCTPHKGYPVTVNEKECTNHAADVMVQVLGKENVKTDLDPCMAGEDFSFMLEKIPGNYLWLGNGDSDGLHTVNFDFNDAVIPIGITYWMELAKHRLPTS